MNLAISQQTRRLALLFLALAIAILWSLSAAPASAEAKIKVGNLSVASTSNIDCSKKKCRDFSVVFYVSGKVRSSATICWLGNCRLAAYGAANNRRGWFSTNYSNVGPYRCGSATTAKLIYAGRAYQSKTRIACLNHG